MTKKIGIYIDFDNAFSALKSNEKDEEQADLLLQIFVQEAPQWLEYIKKYLSDKLKIDISQLTIIKKRSYFNPRYFGLYQNDLFNGSIVGVSCPQYTATGKTGADGFLQQEIAKDLYKSDIDIFVIITSDTDFIPVILHVQEEGKQIFLLSLTKRINSYLNNIIEKIDSEEFVQFLKTIKLSSARNFIPVHLTNKSNITNFGNITKVSNKDSDFNGLDDSRDNRHSKNCIEESPDKVIYPNAKIISSPSKAPIDKNTSDKINIPMMHPLKYKTLLLRGIPDKTMFTSNELVKKGEERNIKVRLRMTNQKIDGYIIGKSIVDNLADYNEDLFTKSANISNGQKDSDLNIKEQIRSIIQQEYKLQPDLLIYFDFEIDEYFKKY